MLSIVFADREEDAQRILPEVVDGTPCSRRAAFGKESCFRRSLRSGDRHRMGMGTRASKDFEARVLVVHRIRLQYLPIAIDVPVYTTAGIDGATADIGQIRGERQSSAPHHPDRPIT